MAKLPLIASRTLTAQPNANETRKEQKAFQQPEEYDAQALNQALDRLHERVNKLATESLESGDVIEDLTITGVAATDAAAAITRLNLFAEILRNAGLLRRTK